MAVDYQNSVVGGVTVSTLTLENPPLNILGLEHCRDLVSCLHEIHADDRARVVVIRGAGDAFSAGVDIRECTRERMPQMLPIFHEIFHQLLNLRAFTVAAVHGHCLGGAAKLACACDRFVATADANFGLPEISLGCFPPAAIPLFPFKLPHGRAVEMMISGRQVPVAELAQQGLVDRVADGSDLDSAVAAEIELFAGKSPAVLGMLADLVHEEARSAWGDRIPHMEQQYLEKLLPQPDVAEGIAAFLEKREPKWQDPDERPDPLDVMR